ncbi:MAG: hypothetical protein M1462_06630 [Candidatus Thermoplasmatota archaeon]|nr:hypothetical protein [Candidatus Thermoplasmatota archaeon]
MANEKSSETNLASDSFEELRYIFNWSLRNSGYRTGDIILIGGWAVHSVNPWKYSLDIDLIATTRFKDSLKEHLYSTRHYSKEKDPEGNTLFLKSLDSGEIYLDFLPKKDRFHGTGKILNLEEIEYETKTTNISYSFESSFQVIVPEIAMLLLLKLKAAWDRYYDLSSETTLNKDHLNEKFIKDCGDILALLQSRSFQFARFDLLSLIISKFDFLRGFMEEGIIEENSSLDRVSYKDGKELIEKLLSLI